MTKITNCDFLHNNSQAQFLAVLRRSERPDDSSGARQLGRGGRGEEFGLCWRRVEEDTPASMFTARGMQNVKRGATCRVSRSGEGYRFCPEGVRFFSAYFNVRR
jgi:hypothetical protein